MPGILYLVGTPIGNLEDMTARAVRILKEAAVIAAEDTRRTQKLLNYFGIKTPMLSYHKHNERERAEELIGRLLAGDSVALVTDAGTPGISDPGEIMARKAIEAGIGIESIPGPSACILALTVSGLDAGGFFFRGFLPRQKKDRARILAELTALEHTIILYEAPHHLADTLSDLAASLGGERKVAVARELTKLHEEVWRGELTEALAYYQSREIKGEITLVIAGRKREAPAAVTMEEARVRVEELVGSGRSLKESVREAAKQTGVSKNQLYQACLGVGQRRP